MRPPRGRSYSTRVLTRTPKYSYRLLAVGVVLAADAKLFAGGRRPQAEEL